MKTPMRWIVAALVPVAGAVSALPVVTPTASASSATANWSTLDQTGLAAASAYRGDGVLAVVGSPSPVSDSTVTTASGVISVAQRTVVADDTSGTVLVNLTLLGGRQLVVTERSPVAGFAGATLVLEPGTSTVAGTYPQPAIAGTATSMTTGAARHGSTAVPVSPATLRQVSSAAHRARHGADRLVTIGGCVPDPAPPDVIGSTFGPLVQGEGVISCGTTETLAEIVADYRGNTHVGNTATGSGRGNWLGINAYYACSVISGTNGFETDELWAVHGTVQGGAQSSPANLHCA